MSTSRRALSVLGVLLFAQPAFALSNSEQLQAFNTAALAAYAAGKSQMLAKRGPAILVGEDITLLADGKETRVDYIPATYTNQKTVAHLALGAVVVLEAFADDPAANAATWKPHLEKLLAQAQALKPIVGTLGFDDDALARANFVLDKGSAFISSTLAAGTYTRADLQAFARDLTPILLGSATSVAKAQIDGLHRVVEEWRAQMSPEEWAKVRVVVLGPHMPRDGNILVNYFRFAFGKDEAEKRVTYAENVFDKAGGLNLLGTILTDRRMAKLVFDDEMRMDRDLLSDAAQAYLLEKFGKLGKSRP
ncbi:hypothetical protein ABLE91_01065 [Aquabacter sp. CN5-332]|uniref:hypothetical protein n=1 Tax=Aquabacter sp. CN5-332 TaxID=3156608 RepID=UPI0032B4318F